MMLLEENAFFIMLPAVLFVTRHTKYLWQSTQTAEDDQVKSVEDEKKWKGAARPNELLEKGIDKKVTEA